jgi:hypothetical protein
LVALEWRIIWQDEIIVPIDDATTYELVGTLRMGISPVPY